MPILIRFGKDLGVKESEKYINECCVGGDLALEEIMKTPGLGLNTYEKTENDQEDWGWFLWMFRGKEKYEINISFSKEPTPNFEIHFVRIVKSGLFSKQNFQDNEELVEMKEKVKRHLAPWAESEIVEEPLEL